MVKTCDICNKTFKYNYLLERHKNKKNPCQNIKENSIVNVNDDIKKTEITCSFCGKKMLKNHIKRHFRTSCHLIPESKRKFFINDYNNKYKNKININNGVINNNKFSNINNGIVNNIDNITNNTNNFDVKINPLGEEDISFITEKDKIKILNRRYMGVPDLIEKVHNFKGNHNMFVPNMNKNTLAYLDKNNNIVYEDYKEVCTMLIETNIKRFDMFYDELKKKISGKPLFEGITKVVEDNGYGRVNDKYENDIKYYIINSSKTNKKDINNYISMINNNINNDINIKKNLKNKDK